ncbi:hypothetical protein [Nitrospirillum iridis]|uniref:Transmembrane protein n=1 Tax=Nitrospirillum iridis TaxID=765888 RepID=A0A7X0EHR5_9PROT|nr:hypothetical protein [Nitrospirillum iridis]MBB6255406.1 hypothetical protein [Nitrospirillum iridis]
MPDAQAKIGALYAEAQQIANGIAISPPSVPASSPPGSQPVTTQQAVKSPVTAPISPSVNSSIAQPSTQSSWKIARQAHAFVLAKLDHFLARAWGIAALIWGAIYLQVKTQFIPDRELFFILLGLLAMVASFMTTMVWTRISAKLEGQSRPLLYFHLGGRELKAILISFAFNILTSIPIAFLQPERVTPLIIIIYYLAITYISLRIFPLLITSIALGRPQTMVQSWVKGRGNVSKLFGVLVLCALPCWGAIAVAIIGAGFALNEYNNAVLAIVLMIISSLLLLLSIAITGVGLQKFDEYL